jgi:hypothetical protein
MVVPLRPLGRTEDGQGRPLLKTERQSAYFLNRDKPTEKKPSNISNTG